MATKRKVKGNGEGERSAADNLAGTSGTTGTGTRTRSTPQRKRTQNDLRKELRQFVADHPQGWGHDDWLSLIETLRVRGHSADDSEQIGDLLERERLMMTLEHVAGVGPHRMRMLADHYGTLWGLRHADPLELAQAIKVPRTLAESIKSAASR
jgi:hypothetical protein